MQLILSAPLFPYPFLRQICSFLLRQRNLPPVLLRVLLGHHPLPCWSTVSQAPGQGAGGPPPHRPISLVLTPFLYPTLKRLCYNQTASGSATNGDSLSSTNGDLLSSTNGDSLPSTNGDSLLSTNGDLLSSTNGDSRLGLSPPLLPRSPAEAIPAEASTSPAESAGAAAADDDDPSRHPCVQRNL